MRYIGAKSWQFGGFESSKLLEWLWPVLWTAGLTYGSSWIAALTEQGGWRAVLAMGLTLAGRGIYAWARDNSKRHT